MPIQMHVGSYKTNLGNTGIYLVATSSLTCVSPPRLRHSLSWNAGPAVKKQCWRSSSWDDILESELASISAPHVLVHQIYCRTFRTPGYDRLKSTKNHYKEIPEWRLTKDKYSSIQPYTIMMKHRLKAFPALHTIQEVTFDEGQPGDVIVNYVLSQKYTEKHTCVLSHHTSYKALEKIMHVSMGRSAGDGPFLGTAVLLLCTAFSARDRNDPFANKGWLSPSWHDSMSSTNS